MEAFSNHDTVKILNIKSLKYVPLYNYMSILSESSNLVYEDLKR